VFRLCCVCILAVPYLCGVQGFYLHAINDRRINSCVVTVVSSHYASLKIDSDCHCHLYKILRHFLDSHYLFLRWLWDYHYQLLLNFCGLELTYSTIIPQDTGKDTLFFRKIEVNPRSHLDTITFWNKVSPLLLIKFYTTLYSTVCGTRLLQYIMHTIYNVYILC